MNSQNRDSNTRSGIKALPAHERPRERLLARGASTLSNAELLAVLLRTGTASEHVLELAEKILETTGGLSGLMRASQGDFLKVYGIGTTKAAQLMALVELAKRAISLPSSDPSTIDRAEDAAQLCLDMQYLPQEHVRVLLLDSARHVIGSPTVYIGTLNSSILRVSELFRDAIARSSAAIVLVHNHPSGDPTPSPEDFELTHTVIAAGKLLDIHLLDHLIIGHKKWVSLKSLGVAFED